MCKYNVYYVILQRMEEARRAAEAEIRDYNALMQWLDKADEVLQIVEEPIVDIEKEYMVSSCNKKCFLRVWFCFNLRCAYFSLTWE